MKIMNFLFAVLLVTATGFAQNGWADVSEGASWNKTGRDGAISRYVWENRLRTGSYTIRVDGRIEEIWVLRHGVEGLQIMFKRGYYSNRTPNWVDKEYDQAVWGYGKNPELRGSVSNYNYLTNARALDKCGNLIESARMPEPRPVICPGPSPSPSTTTQPATGGSNGGCFPTTTPPVTGGTWPGMTAQPPAQTSFPNQTVPKKKWYQRGWVKVVGGLVGGALIVYGGSKLLHRPEPGPEPNPGSEPNPDHEQNGRPAPSWGPAPGGIILRF